MSTLVRFVDCLISKAVLGCILLVEMAGAPVHARDIRQDSIGVKHLMDSCYMFINTDYDRSEEYALKAIGLAESSGFTRGLIAADNLYVNVLISQGRYQKSFEVASESVELSRKWGNEKYLAKSYTIKGMTGIFLGHFQMAANNLLDAAVIIDKIGTKLEIQQSMNMLSIIFTELKDKDKALEYALKANKLGAVNKHPGTNLMTLMQLARARALNNELALSEKIFAQLLSTAKQLKDSLNITYTYIYSAELAIQQEKYHKALDLYTKAYRDAVKTSFPDFLIYANGGLARTHYALKHFNIASRYLEQGVYHARRTGSENMLRELLLLGAEIKEGEGDLKAALLFRKEFEELNARLLNLDLQQNVHRLEAVFQNSVKEREIVHQKLLIANNQLKISQKDNYIAVAVFLAAILAITALLIWLWYGQKHKMAEKEREVQLLKAMMNGEEAERSRLARDLHDGVGGLLSATKMHLSVLQNDAVFPEMHQRFDHTVSMLDSASHEIRMIAHNLAPDLLMKLGLHKALSAYFLRLQSPNFKIDYLKIGDIPRMESNFELLVYRIVQELVNNVIKHSGSDHALIQLSYREEVLSVTVEDDGVGLKEDSEEGLGLSNLRSRIAAGNGYMEIESSRDNGTTVFVEFDVKQYLLQQVNVPLPDKISI